MWFILPFRVKNPYDRFPYVTVSLIVINILIYALTSVYFIHVRPQAVAMFAVTHNKFTIWRLFTSLFIHGNLLHLLGNMLFLWIFGPSAEARLRPLKFVAIYLLCGFVGGLLEDVVVGFNEPDMPCYGASGAIMGLAGAYLYMFPFANIRVFWSYWLFLLPRMGIADWHAKWVIVYYIAFDILNGIIIHSADGVGHFAHIGGFATGLLAVAILQERRDTEDMSGAQAMRSDLKDVDYLSFAELEALMQHPTENMNLVLAYCDKALLSPGQYGEHKCFTAFQHYATPLLETADINRLTGIILRLHMDFVRQMPSIYFLRLGSMLERIGSYDYAGRVYRRMFEIDPNGRDSEVALYRVGRLMETVFQDHEQARNYYGELLRRFPHGDKAAESRRFLSSSSTPGPHIH